MLWVTRHLGDDALRALAFNCHLIIKYRGSVLQCSSLRPMPTLYLMDGSPEPRHDVEIRRPRLLRLAGEQRRTEHSWRVRQRGFNEPPAKTHALPGSRCLGGGHGRWWLGRERAERAGARQLRRATMHSCIKRYSSLAEGPAVRSLACCRTSPPHGRTALARQSQTMSRTGIQLDRVHN